MRKIVLLLLLGISVICFAQQQMFFNFPLSTSGRGSTASAPVFFNSVSNGQFGAALLLSITNLNNAGSNAPFFIAFFSWLSSGGQTNYPTTVTNNLGVAGTAVTTNYFYKGTGIMIPYWWTNALGMSNAYMHLASTSDGFNDGVGFLFQYTNGSLKDYPISTFRNTNKLASPENVVISNILTSTANNAVAGYSADAPEAVGTPTWGGLPTPTSLGSLGSSATICGSAAYQLGENTQITNTIKWTDSDDNEYGIALTTLVITN